MLTVRTPMENIKNICSHCYNVSKHLLVRFNSSRVTNEKAVWQSSKKRNNCKVGTMGWGVKGHKYLTATEENSVPKHSAEQRCSGGESPILWSFDSMKTPDNCLFPSALFWLVFPDFSPLPPCTLQQRLYKHEGIRDVIYATDYLQDKPLKPFIA